jgi:hypothetical protein
MSILEYLTYVENAIKILLGAQLRQKEVSPIDYCISAMNLSIDVIQRDTNEFSLLNKYINSSNNNSKNIKNIFKIHRKGEAENMEQWKAVPNHTLLFYGSKVFNFIGILSNGLKVAQKEAPACG